MMYFSTIKLDFLNFHLIIFESTLPLTYLCSRNSKISQKHFFRSTNPRFRTTKLNIGTIFLKLTSQHINFGNLNKMCIKLPPLITHFEPRINP